MWKKVISILMAVFVIISTICSLCVSASAATASSTFDCNNVVSFSVKTSSSGKASIKFASSAKKVSCTVNRAFFGKKTYTHICAHAPKMVIYVCPAINGKNYFFVQDSISFNGFTTISSTLKFDKKNTTYRVKVYKLKTSENYCRLRTSEAGIFHSGELVSGYSAYCNGTWKMSKTNCTISNIRVK